MSEDMVSLEEIKSHAVAISFILFILLAYEENTCLWVPVFLKSKIKRISWGHLSYARDESWIICWEESRKALSGMFMQV